MPTITRIYDENRSARPILVELRRKMSDERNDRNIYSTNTPIENYRTTSNPREISTKTKWSTRKQILLSVLLILAVCITVMAIVLPIILIWKTDISAITPTTTTIQTDTSSTVISALWSFDNTTIDSYGIYNGSMINGATFSPISTNQPYVGTGRSLFLTSSSSQSFVVLTPFLNLSYTSFTIESWIYSMTSYTGDNSIFSQCQCLTCANQCFNFIVRASRLYTGFTLNDVSGSTTLTTTLWYHAAFVYNYATQEQILYLNGIQDGIKSNATPYQGMNGTIQIGLANASLSPNYFNGYIDNVKVTSRAKSAAEILNSASLTAYYSFDLPSPTLDNGPNGLNGISVNTATVLGRVNQAMSFTGSLSYFQAYGFYQAGYGVFTNKPFSISMWINPSSTASSVFVQQSTTQSGGSCLNMIGFYAASGLNGQLVLQTYGFPTIYGPFISTNTWTHFSWTYSSTNGYTLYINGVHFGSTGASGLLITNSITWLQIGYNFVCTAANINNVGYQGSIDEIYVHNRELTQTDVTALANP